MLIDTQTGQRTLSIGIDTGGTFTDATLVDRRDGREWKAKVPSTPHDPSIGFIQGVCKVLEVAGLPADRVSHVFHGTTVATNAILEMHGAECALLTTRGFKHVLEIGRHDIPRSANMFSWVKPARPVPPQRIFEIGERLDANGAEIEPLNESDVRLAAQRIRAKGIKSIAICYLHAYANGSHERRTKDLILEEHPEAQVSLSSEVLPTFREFERSMTTVLNAYVMPLISDYVGRLESRLAEEGISQARLLFVKSNGGVAGADTIRHEPVQTALSGPAAGIIGAQNVGRMVGEQRLITLDIGGTSADICLIDGDRPTITTEGSVGHWPVHLPMMAIHTIGAGGGSIARAADGGLTVGPASAGADPGPACYGRGGTEATVTDAHLVLGYLPKRLLDGAMALDLDAATRAIERLANKLGTSTAEAARGVIDVVNNNMIGAIRVVSVERGYNPKEFALVPFGGAGPLHGGFIMRLLGMKASIVARGCGVLSSRGLLIADMKSDFTRTLLLRPPYADLTPLHRLFSELEERAAAWLSVEGVPASGQEIHRFVSFRYANQGYELDVPWLAEGVTMPALQQAIEAFHATHRRLYTFEQRDAQVELTGIRIEAVGRLAKPKAWEAEEGAKSDARTGSQKLYFGGEWVTCGVYDRTRLGDVELVGPAIIEQMDATTLVLPKQVCRSDEHGNLIVREG